MSSVPIPTFDPEPGNSLAHSAAMVSPATLSNAGSPHLAQPQPLAQSTATQYTYSATTCLPLKLVSRIRALEFIEISEMLPEALLPDHQETGATACRPSRSTPVTDILVWTECFLMMEAVLAEQFPDKAAQLLVYLRRVVHAARNFQGTAWVAYDRLYRRQALAQRSLDWAREDSSLYNEAFKGQAKPLPGVVTA